MRRWTAAWRPVVGPAVVLGLVLGLVLGGCSDEPAARPAEPTKPVTATDESFTMSVPEGWETLDQALRGDVVAAERDPDGPDRVVVSHQREETLAEQRAIQVAARLTDEGVFCERFDDDETFGDPALVFDCPADDGTREVLVVQVGEGRSALLVFRTSGATLEETDDLITPILASFTWSQD